ncbi:MAG: hypothetical protein M5R40_18970 [Anaerolineae bacterium]|nr:hypothetical protein [Anaerolineae bacterium]
MRSVSFMLAIFIVFSIGGVAAAQPPAPEIEGATIVATGFNGPQGIPG